MWILLVKEQLVLWVSGWECVETPGTSECSAGPDTTGHHCSLLNVVVVIFSGRKCGLRGFFIISFAHVLSKSL